MGAGKKMKNQNVGNGQSARQSEKFDSTNEVVFDLERGGKILRGELILRGSITITNAGAAGTARFPEHIFAGLIKYLDIEVSAASGRYGNGLDGVIRHYSGAKCLRRAMLYNHKFAAELFGVAGSGAAGTYNIYMPFPVFFALPDMKRPIEYALNADTDAYNAIRVKVGCGAKTDTMNGNAGTWDFSQLWLEWHDFRENVVGDTYVVKEIEHEFTLSGDKTDQLDKTWEPTGKVLDILVCAQNGSSGAAAGFTYADDIVQEVKVAADNCDYQQYGNAIKTSMYRSGTVDWAQAIVGFYHVNFVSSGMKSKAIDAASASIKYDVKNPRGIGNDSLNLLARRYFTPAGFTPIQNGQKGKNQ